MMTIRPISERGCPARENHRLVLGPPVVANTSNKDKFTRLINGMIGVRVAGILWAVEEHPRLEEIKKNLAIRPFGGGV